MSAHLTEEEQIETLKRWWKDYGKQVVALCVVGLSGFYAWNFYQGNKAEVAQEHSAEFERLIVKATEKDGDLTEAQIKELQDLAGKVVTTDSLYGDFAELYSAKLAVEKNDWDNAKVHLQKVVASGKNEAIKDLANLRLARVMFAKGEIDSALAILSSKPNGSYAAAYAEAKGDILVVQKRLPEARAAYEAALAAVGEQSMQKSLLQLKLDNTRSASTPDVGASEPANPHGAAPMPNPHTISLDGASPNPQSAEAGDK